ncbi:uncharacterized protein PG998_012854 [Apiospora kogelbergensis]|uniref:uncharacterized protein n=1 Tax=Apiospora kogelbergensis TaxID=1337665 RepID=UPI00312EACF4
MESNDHDVSSLARLPQNSVPGAGLDLDAMASSAHPQSGSTLMRLPREVRDMIFHGLWESGRGAQHLMFQDGRYLRAECLDEHGAGWPVDGEPDADRDRTLRRRLGMAWGSHWRCERAFVKRAHRQQQQQEQGEGVAAATTDVTEGIWYDPCPTFFAVLLACKQLYLEHCTSIFDFVDFAFHDLETLHQVVAFRPVGPCSLIRHAKRLELAVRFAFCHSEDLLQVQMGLWRECCMGLEQAAATNGGGGGGSLASVYLWMDADVGTRRNFRIQRSEFGVLEMRRDELFDRPVDPFTFGPALAAITTVDLPFWCSSTAELLRNAGQRTVRFLPDMIKSGISKEDLTRNLIPQGLIDLICRLRPLNEPESN